MDMIEVSAKTVNDAITEACQKLGVTSDKLDYEVVEEGSSGFLGIGAKPAATTALTRKPNLSPAVKPTTAVTKTTTRAVTKTNSRKK